MPPNLPFSAALIAALGREDAPLPVFPMKEAQADVLAELVAHSLTVRPSYKRGDRVHYSGCRGPWLPEIKDGLIAIFWRYLDFESQDDQRRFAHAGIYDQYLPELDCLVANYDGQNIQFFLSCSYMLTPGDR